MKRPRQFDIAIVLTLAFILLACGASARQKALRVTFTATAAAQAGFVTWDKDRQLSIVRGASSQAEALTELGKYKDKRSVVLTAFEVTYRTLASAAILDEDQKSLMTAVGAFNQLRLALSSLTNGALP